MVTLWDKSVAIGVQIDVFYLAGSTECFVSVVFSVVWHDFLLLVPGGRLRSRYLQLHFQESLDFTDDCYCVCNRTVLCRLFWPDRLSFGCGAPSLFKSLWSLSSLWDLGTWWQILWMVGIKWYVVVDSCPGGSQRPVAEMANNRSYCDVSVTIVGVCFSPATIRWWQTPMPFCGRGTIFWLMPSLRLL